MSAFELGARVRKISGSSWQGVVVGRYSTSLTPNGVCVESEREPGSVQIYPVHALECLESPIPGRITKGDIVQITSGKPGLVGALVIVDEVKKFGIQGSVHHVSSFEESAQIWLRLTWDQVEKVGSAVLVVDDE